MEYTYTVTLSDAEDKALRYEQEDPQKFIEDIVAERCNAAISEIVKEEVERITSIGGTISGTKFDIAKNAPIETAKEKQQKFLKELNTRGLLSENQ